MGCKTAWIQSIEAVPMYVSGAYNKFDDTQQWIRITDGCPNQCEYCYAPDKNEYYGIPEIVRNEVKILDMNPLAVNYYLPLLPKRLNKKAIHYEMVCGFDWRYITPGVAQDLHKIRFGRFGRKRWQKGVRIAWDYGYNLREAIKAKHQMLIDAGFRPRQIEVFMICDWKVSAYECCLKLIEIHEWGSLVNDCWFDNAKPGKYQLNHWTLPQCKAIRALCRKSNLITLFHGRDPESFFTSKLGFLQVR